MKTKNRVIGYCVLLMVIVTFTACAWTFKKENTDNYVNDPAITTQVKTLFATDDSLNSFQIGVETYNGTVQLSGFVNSMNDSDKAVALTNSVDGIKSVKNSLIVK